MTDAKTIKSWLEGLTEPDWRMYHSDSEVQTIAKETLALLKAQEAVFANLVVDWLREIALNNFDCNRDMTFLDAVEDIRDRASYGLKQYFIDKQDRR